MTTKDKAEIILMSLQRHLQGTVKDREDLINSLIELLINERDYYKTRSTSHDE